MSEEIITTRRGIYGRVSVTLPLGLKTAMLSWAKRSGMKKSEFLRMALTTGFLSLSGSIRAGSGQVDDDSSRVAQGLAPAREEDASSAPAQSGLSY